MAFFRKPKQRQRQAKVSTGGGKRPGYGRRFSLEVKLLAARAREAGMSRGEVARLIEASTHSVDKWFRMYEVHGSEGLMRQGSHPSTKKLCNELEQRIEQFRRENPQAGVRRIRDELKREEAIGVSAETVRRVLNDAGLGNPPPQAKPRSPQPRRFEREVPNAL